MNVLDASTAVNALIPGALRVRAIDAVSAQELIAPALIDSEVASALARLERAGQLTAAQAEAALDVWSALDVERVELPRLLSQAWSLRDRVRLTDGLYVALARTLECPLLTSDARLARAGIPGLDIRLLA